MVFKKVIWHKLESKKAILFDLDGTLLQSLDTLKNVFRDFLSKRNKYPIDEEFENFNGMRLDEIVKALKKHYDFEESVEDLLEDYLAILSDSYFLCKPQPGAENFLHLQVRANKKLGLVTSAPSCLVNPILTNFSWQKIFDVVVTGDMVAETKPKPDLYNLALKNLNLLPEDALAFEDSVSGVTAAVCAGVETIAVCAEHEEILMNNAGASACVLNFEKLNDYSIDPKLEKFSADLKVKIDEDGVFLAPDLLDKIDNCWKNAKKFSNTLFDGTVLCVTNLTYETLHCKRVPYRYFYAQQVDDKIRSELNLKILAVSGICHVGNNYLFGIRGSGNTQFKGRYELVPSGSLDPENKIEDSFVDLKKQIHEELLEESGIDKRLIENLSILGVVVDDDEKTIDVCMDVSLSEGALKDISDNQEYEKLLWIKEVEVKNLDKKRLVPTTLAMLRHCGLI